MQWWQYGHDLYTDWWRENFEREAIGGHAFTLVPSIPSESLVLERTGTRPIQRPVKQDEEVRYLIESIKSKLTRLRQLPIQFGVLKRNASLEPEKKDVKLPGQVTPDLPAKKSLKGAVAASLKKLGAESHENIYTIPNILTATRQIGRASCRERVF